MRKSKDPNTVGVIPARLQVVDFHEGHNCLIQYVLDRHEHVIVALGSTGGMLNERNFLPYDMRREMVLEKFPTITVIEIMDHPLSHAEWSKDLDRLVRKAFRKKKGIAYGSRNSFIDSYCGKMKTVEVPPFGKFNGTSLRKKAKIPNTREVRLGMLKAAKIRYPISFATADIAVLSKDRTKVLLIGRKRE